MTATWDEVAGFIARIGTLKDPEYYGDVLRYLQDVFGDIHDIDHRMDQRISRALEGQRSMKALREFNRKIKHE